MLVNAIPMFNEEARLPFGNSPMKPSDLIFDVGMHRGEDSWFYLQKGFRVVGFEADPELARSCRIRFALEIQQSRMTIVEGAVVDCDLATCKRGGVAFHKYLTNSVWGTACAEQARRRLLDGSQTNTIAVTPVDMRECLARYGVPHYMKIDIEGNDIACLRALMDCGARPDYVSMESERMSFERLSEEIDLLTNLRYDAFKAVNQNRVCEQVTPNPPREGRYLRHYFPEGSSGLFGLELPGPWGCKDDILVRYKKILLLSKLFGERSFLQKSRCFRAAVRVLKQRAPSEVSRTHPWGLTKLFKRLNPGWYDTHARHTSVDYG